MRRQHARRSVALVVAALVLASCDVQQDATVLIDSLGDGALPTVSPTPSTSDGSDEPSDQLPDGSTDQPRGEPSDEPTDQPTDQAADQATDAASAGPTVIQSATPTPGVTQQPTSGPTTSATPTPTPTSTSASNRAPTAGADRATTREDQVVFIAILANDTDPDGDTLRILSIGQPRYGSNGPSGNRVAYRPPAGFVGTDTFTYEIGDGRGGRDTGFVTVTVLANHAPTANDDSATTDAGVAVTIDVLANDSDPDGDALAIADFTQPASGNVSRSGSRLVYTPTSGSRGTQTFTYTLSDGRGKTDTARVTVTIVGGNSAPQAADDNTVATRGVTHVISVLANDFDPDGDVLSVIGVQDPIGGTAYLDDNEVVFDADPDAKSPIQFTYTISDPEGLTDTATITITLNTRPIARDDTVTVVAGGNRSFNIITGLDTDEGTGNADTDPDGDALRITAINISWQDGNGTLTCSTSGACTWAPVSNGSPQVVVAYTLSDGRGGFDTGTLTLNNYYLG